MSNDDLKDKESDDLLFNEKPLSLDVITSIVTLCSSALASS